VLLAVPARAQQAAGEATTPEAAAVKICSGCHGMQLVTDTPRDWDAWHDTVQKMIDRGARGTPEEFDLVMDFLFQNVTPVDVNHADRGLPGVVFVPNYFRPQFQKHRGAVCGGVELLVTDREAFRSYRTGVELLAAIHRLWPDGFAWRAAPYEFVADIPAIDLLTGGPECRQAIESGAGLEDWLATWGEDERQFRAERREVLLYPEADE